jgi:hypothetical protein
VAVAFAAFLGATFWLAVIEEGHGGHILGKTWTSHDFPDGLGNAMGATRLTSRTGLWGTLVIFLVLVGVFIAIERWLPGRGWKKGLSFAPILFLLWGLVYCPLIDSKQALLADGTFVYLPSGLFASNSSLGTIPSAIAASFAAALIIARSLELVRSPEWWRPATGFHDIRDASAEELLELSEQRPQQRSETTR